jgi:hypothetical protein
VILESHDESFNIAGTREDFPGKNRCEISMAFCTRIQFELLDFPLWFFFLADSLFVDP